MIASLEPLASVLPEARQAMHEIAAKVERVA